MVRVPLSSEFKISTAMGTITEIYHFSVQRDVKDDRILTLELKAYDSLGRGVPLISKDSLSIVYIKPLLGDSLTSNDTWEFWMFTGTNFDPFSGAKPQ